MKGVGEPCAGEPHARFDGRGLETERTSVTAPAPDPTNLAHRTYDACMPEPESPSKVSAAAPVASGRGHVGLPPRMADVAKVAGVSHQTTLDPGDLAGSLPCPRDSHRKGQT